MAIQQKLKIQLTKKTHHAIHSSFLPNRDCSAVGEEKKPPLKPPQADGKNGQLWAKMDK